MIVTKTALPRRTFLGGIGAAVALPLLDAMVPALTAQAKTAAAPVHRFGAFYVPNGMHMSSFVPSTEGKGVALSPILSPLEAFKDRIVVVTRLANIQAEAMETGGGPHPRAHAVWLNGVRPKRTPAVLGTVSLLGLIGVWILNYILVVPSLSPNRESADRRMGPASPSTSTHRGGPTTFWSLATASRRARWRSSR